MGRQLSKPGAGPTLPAFLQKTEKYPAFISNARGKILTSNNFFKNICSINNNRVVYVKEVFTGDYLHKFKDSCRLLSSKPSAVFGSAIDDRTICWEVSCLEEDSPNILCVGSINFTKPATKIILEDNHFSAYMNNSPALMWATDNQGRLVVINKKFKEVTGFTDSDLGRTLWEVYPKELADVYKQNDDTVIERNELVEMEESSIDKFGRKREFLVYKFPLQTADYGLVVAGWSVDITEHNTANKKLLHQNNRFRQIARLQSHAVRRPLANILGLIDLIQYYGEQGNFAEVTSMISLLKDSGNDLDVIIKKIVQKAGVFNPELQMCL